MSLTLAELLKASASWQITFTLAPLGRSGEFLATYGLGGAACQVIGPILITGVVLVLGPTGWLLLGLLFVVASIATPAIARRARARPVATRKPPRDHPFSPRLATGSNWSRGPNEPVGSGSFRRASI